MADERERAARAAGDLPRGALAPLTGALLGGALMLDASIDRVVRDLPALAQGSLGGTVAPGALLDASLALVARAALPVAAGAFGGALLLGLVQTRGWLGAPKPETVGDPLPPRAWLGLLGWSSLALVAVVVASALVQLHPGAQAPAIVGAAAILGARALRALIGLLAILALVDHVLRVRARRLRLGLDEPIASRRNTYAAPVVEERMEALVQGARLVLFDEERVVALGLRADGLVPLARARGMAGVALREAARRRGLPVRATASLETFDALTLGEPLSAAVLGAYHLEAEVGEGAS